MGNKLEYILDNGDDFPVLYRYDNIDKDEISLRYDCDYFIKDGVVYEKTDTEEYHGTYMIYVIVAEDEEASTFGSLPALSLFKTGFNMEVRQYIEDVKDYPLITKLNIHDDDDLTLKLKSNYIQVNGRKWKKTSTEIDEDRKVFVYYAIPV